MDVDGYDTLVPTCWGPTLRVAYTLGAYTYIWGAYTPGGLHIEGLHSGNRFVFCWCPSPGRKFCSAYTLGAYTQAILFRGKTCGFVVFLITAAKRIENKWAYGHVLCITNVMFTGAIL